MWQRIYLDENNNQDTNYKKQTRNILMVKLEVN